ncbi:hypothetical protein ACP70R_016915 [Stipagrostis hirtigluma subsp. patula]
MEEANVEGTNRPSIAPESSDLPEGPVDAASLASSNAHEDAETGQSQLRVDQDEMQEQNRSYKASEIADRFIQVIDQKTRVDTAAPIDSVKGAVSKFGGILDWSEKRKLIQDELDKVHQEAAEYHKRSQEAEAGKARALQELGTAASATEELRLSMEKAKAEEAQARQDAELAELRVRELQRGASETTAVKAELDVARRRRDAALADLESAIAELESTEKERAAAAKAANAARTRARETAAASEKAGKAVEALAAELAALKRELESSRAAHDKAEEKRMVLALAFEQEKAQWQTDLEESELEAKKLRDELIAACDLEMKAEAASERLASLKAELLACAVEGTLGGEEEKPTVSSQPALEKTKKELEDAKASVERAKDEAKCLRVAAASMRDVLERQKAELAALRRKEGLSSASIPSLEEELRRVTSELAAAEARAKEGSDESKLQERVVEARREAEQAKAKARSARDEVAKAREEATVAKAAVAAMDARLQAVMREILASNTSAEIATSSAGALLQEPKPALAAKSQGIEGGVTLTEEEYGELSRRAREMEELAGKRVMDAVKLIREAKDAEVRSLEQLSQLARQTEQRRQALQAATLEAEEAEFAKLTAERELRQWHAEHDPQRRPGETDSPRTGLAEISVLHEQGAGDGRANPHILSPRGYMPRTDVMGPAAAGAGAEADARQRKTFLPRMVMFLARKRAQAWK